MKWSALQRARRFGHAPGLWRKLILVSVCSAVLVPLLVFDLGLIVQLLVGPQEPATPHVIAHRVDSPDAETPPPVLPPPAADARRDTPPVIGWLVAKGILPWPFLDNHELFVLALIAAGCVLTVLEAALLLVLQRSVQQSALHVATKLRRAIHAQAFRLGANELLGVSRTRPEELFVDKCETLRAGLAWWWSTVPRSIVALSLLILMSLAVNFWLTLLAILLTGYILRVHRALRTRAEENSKTWQQQVQRHRSGLLKTLRLAPLTTGYRLDTLPGEPFEEGLQQCQAAELRAHTSEVIVQPLMLLILLLAAAFLLMVVGLSDEVTVPGTVLLGAALICAYFPASRLYQLHHQLADAESAAADIFTYLDREPGVGQIADARPLQRLGRQVSLDKVTLADRRGRLLLDGVSLSIEAGSRVALLASDPQTPMALAGLFVRFYDPATGRILYDDHDIRRATLDTVRGQAMLVSADGLVFPGTVAANIACGDSGFTTLQIRDAAERAGAYEFIEHLPQGLSTVVNGGDLQLRTDQAFRIAIARALLREPSLLIVQEPSGSYDEETSRRLDAALAAAANATTLVIIPARLSTLRSADRIYLFHEGKFHAAGTHAELLQSNDLYRHMNYVRFNAFRDKVSW